MLDYLDADLKNFINRYVTSFLAWDLIVFFHKHPGVGESAGDLAMRLGRLAEDIQPAAEELAEKAVLTYEDTIFRYGPAEETRALVEQFNQALENREKRLLILTEVLQRR